MGDYGRRIVLDQSFNTTLADVSRALREEGLQTLGRFDVRHHFQQDLRHDFRRYFLIQAWSPELALEALRANLDVGTSLLTTFAIYELADGETAVVASEPLAAVSADPEWAREEPQLESIAEAAIEKVARVLDRVRHRSALSGSARSAA